MLQAALDKKKVKGIRVTKVAEVELTKAVGRLELTVAGLG